MLVAPSGGKLAFSLDPLQAMAQKDAWYEPSASPTCHALLQVIGISRNGELAWQAVEDLREEFPGAAISFKVGRVLCSAAAVCIRRLRPVMLTWQHLTVDLHPHTSTQNLTDSPALVHTQEVCIGLGRPPPGFSATSADVPHRWWPDTGRAVAAGVQL
jgi:hypothetical protein